MSKVIKIKKGLNILLEGEAQRITSVAPTSETYSISPLNYVGLTPKLLVKEGDKVKAGTPVMFDKIHSQIMFSSPVSGTVTSIERGEKRRIDHILITPDKEIEYEPLKTPTNPSAEQAKEFLLQSGLWPMLIQRPFGVLVDPKSDPRGIFISTFDTSPLAPDMEYILKEQKTEIETALAFLGRIAPVHIAVTPQSKFRDLKFTAIKTFEGKHPAGNVGIQIANTKPISKGETVWTIDIQHLAMMGRALSSGKYDMTKTVALTGSEASNPHYIKCITGASMASITNSGSLQNSTKSNNGNAHHKTTRYISGNPLTGKNVGAEGYLGYYHNQVTLLPEGDHYEFLGWGMPRLDKFSTSRSYFSWLMPQKKFRLDTNLNGGERAFVMNGIYEKVMPMDIYPVYLLKAAISKDIDRMEKLGIYEVIEEDVALCEFICPSKIEWQKTLREAINEMIKEL